ncbi:MAG: GAF domain-containing protein [Mycobacteriaceae bacterium]|nr:GAF domain-containing protein [Mycobacteriaceae bacterium]MBV9641912.1 GAF domain-containing protein [Mycobacteriaceae bacterium]
MIAALLGAALLANFVFGFAAARRTPVDRRRGAGLAAELACLMLRSGDLRSALDQAGQHLARVLELSFASLELDDVSGDSRRLAIPLRAGSATLGTLLVPSDITKSTRRRLRQRIAPSLAGLIAAARERERIDSGLVRSRHELERFFDLSSDLLTIADKRGLIRVNPAFEHALGYSLHELTSLPFDLVVPQDQDLMQHVVRETLSGRPVRFENQAMRRDGSRRWIEWSVAPHGDLFYAVGRDVTQRRREQEQLRHTQAMLEAGRDQLAELATQQAALRRVATLVARGVSPEEVFSAVAEEMGRCLNVAGAAISRYDGDAITMLALADVAPEIREIVGIGERFPLHGDNVSTRVLRTGRAARMDSQDNATGPIADRMRQLGVRSLVAVPIIVGGRVWGTATAGSAGPEPLPLDTEARIADFTDLVATAIANAAAGSELQDSRDNLRVLATQQAALRRVATLVAQGVGSSEVFSAVAEEMARCLNVGSAAVLQYESDGAAMIVATYAEPGEPFIPVGERVTLEGDSVAAMVLKSGRPARMDTFVGAEGSLAARLREMGMQSRVGAPIVVNERLWGVAVVGSSRPEPLPPDIEQRIAEFAELVATAIAASTTRADLIASRARIVAAADDARRRIERDLHDGAQQRLVSLGLKLRMTEDSVPVDMHGLRKEMSDVVSGLNQVVQELQEISRGIHPAILSRGGLAPALKTLARRSVVPVTLDIAIRRRLGDAVEIAAYYVVAEALANAAKHAHASEVTVRAEATDADLHLSICDDGVGGADPSKGSGLIGLKDRIEVLGGQVRIASTSGNGTSLEITIPLVA